MAQQIDVNDNFPEEFYEELARLVIAFGRLEYMVKLCLKDLQGEGFTRGMALAESKRQFQELCNAVKSHSNTTPSLSSLIDQAMTLADYRNDTIHALWTTDNETGQPYRIRPKWIKASRDVEWHNDPMVLEELRAKRRKMEQVYKNLDVARRA